MIKYKSDWSRYSFPESEARFASKEELKNNFTTIKLNSGKFDASGIPLIVDGNEAVVNDETEHYIIFGETGCKKTRCVIRPLIPILSGAGESSIVLDVKGELSTDSKIRNYLSSKGIKQVFLDFRDFDGDGYNILEYAAKLYRKGNKDKAMSNVASFISALNSKYLGTKADPYWQDMSAQHMISIVELLFEISKNSSLHEKYVNMLSLAAFSDESATQALENFIRDHYNNSNSTAIQMLKGVFSAPDKTRASIISTTASLLRDFIIQEGLLKMLSVSTFDITKIYEEPTCIFIIVPDETSAYDDIAGLLIDNFYYQLVNEYTEKYQNVAKPNCRVNFVIDEFCNVKINDMRAKCSASRSREIRMFLVAQSLHQLEATYASEASTIIGNCKNILFLQSSDPDMLGYISNLCGTTTISFKDCGEPLLPVERLKKLKKTYEYKEAIYIRDDIVFKAILPDVDSYEFLKKYEDAEFHQIQRIIKDEVKKYTPGKMISDICYEEIAIPFTSYNKKSSKTAANIPKVADRNTTVANTQFKKILEDKFDEVLDTFSEEDDWI